MAGDTCLNCSGKGIVNLSTRADDPDFVLCGKCDSLQTSLIAELETINGMIEAPLSIQRAEELNKKLNGVITVLGGVDFNRRASEAFP